MSKYYKKKTQFNDVIIDGEFWKPITGFSRYEASSCGRLRSINYKNSGLKKILSPALSGGYLKTVLLNDNGKYKSWNVHKFIALAFFDYSDKYEVNHIDCNKLNNKVSNLELVTRSENMLHAFKNKLLLPRAGSLNGNSKLKEADVIEIRNFYKNRTSNRYGRKALAEKYGISESHLKDIISCRRNVWKYV